MTEREGVPAAMDLVPDGAECPVCGEERADRLAWDDVCEFVFCTTCGTEYVPGEDLVINGAIGTHGCRDSAVVRPIGNGKAVVIEAHSCHSCWQVGHDDRHIFYKFADIVDLTDWCGATELAARRG